MSTRKKRESIAAADEADSNAGAGSTGSLLQRLLRKIPGTGGQKPADGTAKAPPGQRSGSGADSVAPYLDETRNSRPGPLE